MAELAVALILLALSILLCISVFAVCRFFGVWRMSSLFASGEEKTGLTDQQPYNGYTASKPGQTSDKYDPAEKFKGPEYEIRDHPPPVEDPEYGMNGEKVESPLSDTLSIASEIETLGGDAGGGRLQRAMSCDSVSSDSSILDVEPEMPRIGQLEFAIELDRQVGELVVSVIQARGLEPDQVTGTLDSYVKVWLTPAHTNKQTTKIQKDSTDPVYKERFLFNIDPEQIDRQTVQFQVFSCDKYARHKLQGETELRLGDIELRKPLRLWMNLRDMDQKPTELGDLMFSLSYLPTAERLTVVIAKARNLRWSYSREAGDCFVKVYLLQNGKKVSKKKTSTKRNDKDPNFNEAMIFSLPASALQSVQLRLTVVELMPPDYKSSTIGHVIVGASLSGTELSHWNQMITSLRKPIAMWHRLRK